MKPKFTLVPSEYFNPESAGEILSKVVLLEEGEPLSFLDIPGYDAVLLYAGEQRPVVYDMLLSLCKIREHYKILASHRDGYLYIVIAQGESLMFCNAFQAADFTTALYFVFHTMQKLQLNPQVSCLYFMEELSQEQLISLFRYFKNVEVLR